MAASPALARSKWASGIFLVSELPVRPAMPTEFELLIEQRELANSPRLWQYDDEIKKWVRANKNKRFVPESLLRELNMHVVMDE